MTKFVTLPKLGFSHTSIRSHIFIFTGLINLGGSLLMPISLFTCIACIGKWKLPQSSPTLHELIDLGFLRLLLKYWATFLEDGDK